jgi:hypothetical protein
LQYLFDLSSFELLAYFATKKRIVALAVPQVVDALIFVWSAPPPPRLTDCCSCIHCCNPLSPQSSAFDILDFLEKDTSMKEIGQGTLEDAPAPAIVRAASDEDPTNDISKKRVGAFFARNKPG